MHCLSSPPLSSAYLLLLLVLLLPSLSSGECFPRAPSGRFLAASPDPSHLGAAARVSEGPTASGPRARICYKSSSRTQQERACMNASLSTWPADLLGGSASVHGRDGVHSSGADFSGIERSRGVLFNNSVSSWAGTVCKPVSAWTSGFTCRALLPPPFRVYRLAEV